MARFITTATFFLFALMAYAQEFEYYPNPVLQSGPADEFSYKGKVKVYNTTTETLEVLWVADASEAIEGWDWLICDINQCYPLTTDCPSDVPSIINAKDTVDFYIEVRPKGIEGNATIYLELFNKRDPEDRWGTIEAIFDLKTTSVDNSFEDLIQIFPNPTKGDIKIVSAESIKHVEIINAQGRVLYIQDYLNQDAISLAGLPNGFYQLRLFNEKGILVGSEKIIKQ